MRKIKITSTEDMPGNQPGQKFEKTPEAIEKEAEKLKGKKVPILDKNGNPTGKYAENIRAETVLYGDADLKDDEKISMHYTPVVETDANVEVQHELNIQNLYVTETPRMISQRADSLPNQGVSPTSQSNTPVQERSSATAPAPPTPPVQPAPAAPAPAPQPEQEPADVRELKDMATREYLKTQLAGLNITETTRAKIQALPLKKQFEQIAFLRDAIPPAPVQTPPAPAAPAAQAESPVAVPPNTNALAQPAPKEVHGVPFEEMRVDPGNGQPPRIIKKFDPTYIVGRDRINAPKRGRPTA